MHISEFASRVAETPFYESIGLLPDPGREPNDYRNYDDCDCDRVRLIRAFQAAGLALNDIARLLTIRFSQRSNQKSTQNFAPSSTSEPDSPTSGTLNLTPRSAPWLPTDAETNSTL